MRQIDLDFDPSRVPQRWYADDLFLSLFFDSLSLLFPDGERFFVDSVRRFRSNLTDPTLLADVTGFIGQEAMHGRAHRAFNDTLAAQGLDLAPRLRELRRLLDVARRILSPRAQLAVTCALEHFTAILAEQLLRRPDHRAAIDPSVRPLWLWHAYEESEHKSVAFDVYRTVGGTYALRIAIMLLTTVIFFAEVLNVHLRLLFAHRLLFLPRAWRAGLGWLLVRPGLLRRLVPAYFDYYRPTFHPSDRDTRALLDTWRTRLFDDAGALLATAGAA
jgi:predicted metal-dependent hydrolase